MITKFKTEVVSIAFTPRAHLPRELKEIVALDVHAIIALYSRAVCMGEAHQRLMKAIGEFCLVEMQVTLENLGRVPKKEVVPCTDWARGLRTPHGTCTNCGAKH